MRIAAASPSPAQDAADLQKAAREMEAILLRQMLRSSGAYGGGEGPGASIREDMFVNALADAVVQAGGLGLAETLVGSMGAAPPPQERSSWGPTPAALGPAALRAAPSEEGRRPSPAPSRGAPTLLSATPLAGHVGSGFGLRTDPFTGLPREHHGVDVGAVEGAPIRATSDGVVLSAGPRGGYGFAVEVDHGNGLTTLYGHASELLVTKGEVVHAGQEIAKVGSTGRSTGPHLHFEVRVGGKAIDPARVLKVYSPRVETDLRSGP